MILSLIQTSAFWIHNIIYHNGMITLSARESRWREELAAFCPFSPPLLLALRSNKQRPLAELFTKWNDAPLHKSNMVLFTIRMILMTVFWQLIRVIYIEDWSNINAPSAAHFTLLYQTYLRIRDVTSPQPALTHVKMDITLPQASLFLIHPLDFNIFFCIHWPIQCFLDINSSLNDLFYLFFIFKKLRIPHYQSLYQNK